VEKDFDGSNFQEGREETIDKCYLSNMS